jgi:8-oxo-dGTP pyrophosphatase MutT (NUDIX family)
VTPVKKMRPRDAASLILLRGDDRDTKVLMGRREPRQSFMPGVFVFPGGAVDRSDGFVRSSDELRPDVLAALSATCTAHRARAIALAGIRETWEETGLMLGRPSRAAARTPVSWRAFTAAGLAPTLGGLDYIARAVTPPGPPRRFHARFFLSRSAKTVGSLSGNGELLDLDWYPLQTAFGLPIAGVTQLVLKEVAQIVFGAAAANTAIPFFTRHGGRRMISYE